jgi:lipoate-protein ligase A
VTVKIIRLELTLSTPEENLACDEALLEQAEEQGGPALLRFWEPAQPFVVLGYANRVQQEVDLDVCRERKVPVLRRCSGGGTVLQAPGCLNYSLLLPVSESGSLATIPSTNVFVMERHARVLTGLLGEAVTVEGITDLAVGLRKCSGNAQRRRQGWLLFHGTFLFGFDPALVMALLRSPPRQPSYRRRREHTEFMMSLPLPAGQVKEALAAAWDAGGTSHDYPRDRVSRLVQEKYATETWNLKW